MRVGEARGGEVYMRKKRHLMATVKILALADADTDVVTVGAGRSATILLQDEMEGSRQLRRLVKLSRRCRDPRLSLIHI